MRVWRSIPMPRNCASSTRSAGAEKATYDVIPFGSVSEMVYERSKSPRVKSAIFLSPLPCSSPGKKHWLTIEYEGGYAYMRLDRTTSGRSEARSEGLAST